MRTVRIYAGNQTDLRSDLELELNPEASAHLCRVLRFNAGDALQVFDGLGHEFKAVMLQPGKNARIKVEAEIITQRESPLQVSLGQVISRGDKMDFTLQKSVELGIMDIYPLTSERCGVKLNEQRMQKKIESWQKIVNGACEQCGRSFVPQVHAAQSLEQWCQQPFDGLSLTLDPYAKTGIGALPAPRKVRLLIGPEGGFTDQEVKQAASYGFTGVTLGPRILRTETAALTALAVLGAHFGDLH